MDNAYWLPVIFVCLMGFAVFVYAVLDGYDLGVGILLPANDNSETHRDTMIASIGPFWDANETWLVLAVGLMLIAFPAAHSLVFYHLYIPAAFMLIGLILRGVAFDFRAKASIGHKLQWDRCFKFGSILTSSAQGFMLGRLVVGFENTPLTIAFSLLSAVCVTAAYVYIGAAWLVYKTESELQLRAIQQTKTSGRLAILGIVSVCIVNPAINPEVLSRWFQSSYASYIWVLPSICFAAFWYNDRLLSNVTKVTDKCWRPILLVIAIFLSCMMALGISFFPDLIPNQINIWEAASAPESLSFILKGTVLVVPIIIAYTVFSYWVFRGKATQLRYH